MSDFVSAINKFQQKAEVLTTSVFRESCRDISVNIATKSPVSTGRLLGQWAPSAGTQSSYSFQGGASAWRRVPGGYQKDEGIAAINRGAAMGNLMPRISSAVASLNKQSAYYFTNNTPYIQNAEHEGWRGTGPYHMIETSVLGWKQTVGEVAMRLKGV